MEAADSLKTLVITLLTTFITAQGTTVILAITSLCTYFNLITCEQNWHIYLRDVLSLKESQGNYSLDK
jgi:hypothetical protein